MARPKCVVLGGSFNPPTKAHEQLMLHAMTHINAEYGIFVPSSDAYVRRKMKKAKETVVFTEQGRARMLKTIARRHPEIQISYIEYKDDGKGHTYDTMRKLQKQYPDRELCFLLGSDKLRILPKWHDITLFLRQFKIALMSRSESDARKLIANNPLLSQFESSFLHLPEMPEIQGISSTAARHALYELKTMLGRDITKECMDELELGLAENTPD